MLRQVYTRQSDTKSYLEATVKTCSLHLKEHQIEAAFQDYAELLTRAAARCRRLHGWNSARARKRNKNSNALSEYQQLAKAYPTDRQGLTAQLSAARLCLKQLNRPKDALALYQAAMNSPIPHLDWDQIIQSGMKEAKNALTAGNAAAASAQ